MTIDLKHKFLSVFPAYAHLPALLINMNDELARGESLENGKSKFLTPEFTSSVLNGEHDNVGAYYSFGGYLEDRRDLWAGSYLEKEQSVHLGIDVNAPAGTMVAPVHNCHVAKVVHDPDQEGGWGSVIVFELEEPIGEISHFIYAHLAKDSVTVKPGDFVPAGEPVAELGEPHENGGWYEHLHVQAMIPAAWDMMKGRDDMGAFDGYDSMPEDGKPHRLSPDPTPLLGLR